MSELNAEAPLASCEEWSELGDLPVNNDTKVKKGKDKQQSGVNGDKSSILDFTNLDVNFNDHFSNSLEDLVNNFDQKITESFESYEEPTEKLAPVQVRTQEDIINNSQMWWTLTGNYGNILPINWPSSQACKLHLSSLHLHLNYSNNNSPKNSHFCDNLDDNSLDEEDLAKELDLHSLILSSLHHEPFFTAEQVLEEIDEIMQESPSDSFGLITENNDDDYSNERSSMHDIRSLMYREKLENLTSSQLNELYLDLERLVQRDSEVLIQELALRDELEYDKELKNQFISLLLGIQNKRRQHHMERKKGKIVNELKYLTTVIPYNPHDGPPDTVTLQILIKILKAVNEDSPTVPTLLTDFILKVLCPT